jgi:hypothetical protein
MKTLSPGTGYLQGKGPMHAQVAMNLRLVFTDRDALPGNKL